MRLIDIDDISLRKTIACGGLSAKALWRRIQQQPTIDAVEVVRGEALPSADRPQGEWLDYEIPSEDGGAMPIQVCSLCKTFYPLAYTGGGHRFCPNCGAKMKGADDE